MGFCGSGIEVKDVGISWRQVQGFGFWIVAGHQAVGCPGSDLNLKMQPSKLNAEGAHGLHRRPYRL